MKMRRRRSRSTVRLRIGGKREISRKGRRVRRQKRNNKNEKNKKWTTKTKQK